MLKVYLDSNVWSRPLDKPSQRIINEANAFFEILGKSYEGKLWIVGSVVLDAEINSIENIVKSEITERLLSIFVSERVNEVPIPTVQRLIEETRVRLPDAAHIACSIEAGCKYFITCDDEIIKKRGMIERLYGIKVYNPAEFINIGEEKMVAKAEEIKILEKVLDLAKRELNPVEYAKFLAFVTPKIGDSVKEIRKFRDTISDEEFLKLLKKKGAKITH